MFCPRCAVQNLDDAKFCRGCGTSLEGVALALSRQNMPVEEDARSKENWVQKRRRGVNKLVRAGGLLGSSLLIGAALGLFSHAPDWIVIWMVFCGWMAVWGILSLTSGLQALLEAKYIRRDLEAAESKRQLWEAARTDELPAQAARKGLLSPQSVTEHTTRSLTEHTSAKRRNESN